MPRKRIPDKTHARVVLDCRRRCALCFGLDGDDGVQFLGHVVHVDRNSENRDESNLCYLCVKHHAAYDLKGPQVKALMPGELLEHKRLLLEHVSALGQPERVGVVAGDLDVQHAHVLTLTRQEDGYELWIAPVDVCRTELHVSPDSEVSAALLSDRVILWVRDTVLHDQVNDVRVQVIEHG